MNSSKWIWRTTAAISIAATITLLIGFIYAYQDINQPTADSFEPVTSEREKAEEASESSASETEEFPVGEKDGEKTSVLPPLPERVKVTALGDSLAKGTGDNSGEGYVRRSITRLNEIGVQSELLNNLAINGLTTEGLLSNLKDSGMQYALEKSDLILLSIGGNDLFQNSGLTDNAQAQSGEAALDPEQLVQEIPAATERLKQIIQSIREINPTARILYLGLYHPFGDIEELLLPGNMAVSSWNYAAQQVINEDANAMLIPTFDLFQGKLEQYLSGDHFHPNGEGYQQIADRIAQGLQ
ncbi:lipolytic protein G-D-S-L family [Paenibacillus algicola]|uniref:Lipolytic protein G-D-S-L family n=1 Tax=Paenibacillus algicola TaxID=2565926 RepID=A0A4P8XLV1_9BACL|nr:GDSL-type esterase/lipase family protein [Paenibacillus algicola]QCT02640.1 lipolytic protein G-D-S-L family [Paenibacillus algicola]